MTDGHGMTPATGKQVTFALLAWTPWLIAAVAGLVALRALLGQAQISSQLGDALIDVRENAALARQLTHRTADLLEPMANTATTLRSMNSVLASTTTDLKAMNGSLDRVVTSQQSILAGVERLNIHTREVVQALSDVGARNETTLKTTTALAAQTAGQADTLRGLSVSAGQSIDHMQRLNRRLAFLKRLPF